jgi:hypothetical protein
MILADVLVTYSLKIFHLMRFFEPLACFAAPLILYIESKKKETPKNVTRYFLEATARKHIREKKANPSRNKNFLDEQIYKECKAVFVPSKFISLDMCVQKGFF